MLTIHTSSSPFDEAVDTLKKKLFEHEGKDILLLFSGGSAFALVDNIHPKILSKKHTISVLDERYTFDEGDSNFSILSRTSLFKQAVKNGAQTIDPRPLKDEPLSACAQRFDLALKHWHILHRDGVVLVTMGIGPDGHTSGILPMPEDSNTFSKLFFDEKVCAVGYQATPDKNPHTDRITTTATYLQRHVEHATVVATGLPKKGALLSVAENKKSVATMPAMILQKMKHVDLFTDISLN